MFNVKVSVACEHAGAEEKWTAVFERVSWRTPVCSSTEAQGFTMNVLSVPHSAKVTQLHNKATAGSTHSTMEDALTSSGCGPV